MFKPHHLELFYYVARHGGISAASRHMPYGLGQPAISGQMTDFERWLGLKLFERKPFQLTEPGRLVYAHLGPFYDGLGPLEQQLRGSPAHLVRIVVDEQVGPEFLSALAAAVAPHRPRTCFELRTGPPDEVEAYLQEHRAHLAITTADRHIRGIKSLTLARPGLRLLVPRKGQINSPSHFWRQGRVAEQLICPAGSTALLRPFERGLQALRVEWPVGIRVDSTAIMLRLVTDGLGVGVTLAQPTPVGYPEVRAIPLANFDPVPLTVRWRSSAGPWLDAVLPAVQATAQKL